MSSGRIVVAITGASGAIYARRFLQKASRHYKDVYLMASRQAAQVAATEFQQTYQEQITPAIWTGEEAPNIQLLDDKNYFTPPASGSFRHDGMVIIPCSMGTAGRIANGISDSLVTRAADVCLKEKRPLIVVPRETPWNVIMLRNLTSLAEAGATVLPACPPFYHHPKSFEDLADTIVDRVLQALGVITDSKEWMIE